MVPFDMLRMIFRDGLKAVLSRQSQGREVESEARQGSNILNRGEARQGGINSRILIEIAVYIGNCRR